MSRSSVGVACENVKKRERDRDAFIFYRKKVVYILGELSTVPLIAKFSFSLLFCEEKIFYEDLVELWKT